MACIIINSMVLAGVTILGVFLYREIRWRHRFAASLLTATQHNCDVLRVVGERIEQCPHTKGGEK